MVGSLASLQEQAEAVSNTLGSGGGGVIGDSNQGGYSIVSSPLAAFSHLAGRLHSAHAEAGDTVLKGLRVEL